MGVAYAPGVTIDQLRSAFCAPKLQLLGVFSKAYIFNLTSVKTCLILQRYLIAGDIFEEKF